MDDEYNKYKFFLKGFSEVIKEEALEAKKKSRGPKFNGYEEGYCAAYGRVIELMQQFSAYSDVDLKELYLDDIEPYRDLL